MAISNLGDILITCGLDMRYMLLNTCINQMMFFTVSKLIEVLVIFLMYRMPRIFKILTRKDEGSRLCWLELY